MAKVIQVFTGTFTSLDQLVSLAIPRGSEEVAIRVLGSETAPAVVITVITDAVAVALTADQLYTRAFEMVPEGQTLPVNFKKYVATLPFRPEKQQVHIIEV